MFISNGTKGEGEDIVGYFEQDGLYFPDIPVDLEPGQYNYEAEPHVGKKRRRREVLAMRSVGDEKRR